MAWRWAAGETGQTPICAPSEKPFEGIAASAPPGDGYIHEKRFASIPGRASPGCPKTLEEKPAYSDWRPAVRSADASPE
jgi:hypothetical protein